MPDGSQLLMLFRPGPQIGVLSDWTRSVPAGGAR
jgi:hypothetical protein